MVSSEGVMCVCVEHGIPGGSEGEGGDRSSSGHWTALSTSVWSWHQCAHENTRAAPKPALHPAGNIYTRYIWLKDHNLNWNNSAILILYDYNLHLY